MLLLSPFLFCTKKCFSSKFMMQETIFSPFSFSPSSRASNSSTQHISHYESFLFFFFANLRQWLFILYDERKRALKNAVLGNISSSLSASCLMKLRFVVFVELLVVMKVLEMPRKKKAALDKGQRSSDGRKQHLSKQHNDTRWRCAHRTKVSPCSSCHSLCFLVCVLSISFFLRSFSGSPDFFSVV